MRAELNVQLRKEMGKKSFARNLRKDGFVPGTCYGALKETVAIYVSAKELKLALSTEAREHVLLNLKADKGSELNSKVAILKSLDRHPIKRDYIHADFQVLDVTKSIKVTVEVKLFGKPKGVELGGLLDQVRRVVDVKCLPTEIPSHIAADVSELDLGDSLHVSDIEAPGGVEILTSGSLTIANVALPQKVVEEEVVVEGEEGEEEAADEAAGDTTEE